MNYDRSFSVVPPLFFSGVCNFVLSQFDVHSWLTERRPMMSDRSKLVTAVGVALQACGLEPINEEAVLSDVSACTRQ